MSETVTGRVSAYVRAEARRQGISQADIGRAIGKSQAAAWRRLVGMTAFDVDELTAVAGLLNVPVSTLMERAA